MARKRRTDCRAAAVEGDVHEVETERQAKQFAHEMRRRACPRRGEAVFAGISFDQRDSSPTVCTGSAGWTVSTAGAHTAMVTGSKSAMGS